MTSLIRPSDVAARLRAGERAADIFGRPGARRTKLAGPQAEVTAGKAARSFDFVISTASVDRYGDVLHLGGWRFEAYRRNPVVLWAHDDTIPAIARASGLNIIGREMRATATFPDRGVYELADTIHELLANGFLGAASVGFIPISCKLSTDPARPGGLDITTQELLEWSVVNIPANPDCIADAKAFGINTRPLIGWAERALDAGALALIERHRVETVRAAAGAPRVFQSRLPQGARRMMRTRATTQFDSKGRPRKWESFGEFLKTAAMGSSKAVAAHDGDERLVRAPTGAGEVDPTSGGFLVPPQYATELLGFAYEEATLAPLCHRVTTSRPLGDCKIPAISEASRIDGSRWGGALAFWRDEGPGTPKSFPAFRQLQFDGHKLIAVMPLTNELLNDVPLMEDYVGRIFGAEIGFKLDLAILAGTGAGTPQGMLTSSALVKVTKAVGQAAATVVADNVNKMWAALPAPSRKTAVWIGNEDVETQLSAAAPIGDSSTAGMYFPAGINGNEHALVKGRPLLVVEQAPALGSTGDLVVADLRHYILVENDPSTMLSLHVLFDSDQAMFRFTLRVDGKSAFASPIAAFNGSGNRSPFAAIAPR